MIYLSVRVRVYKYISVIRLEMMMMNIQSTRHGRDSLDLNHRISVPPFLSTIHHPPATMEASTSYLPPSHHFDAFASILRTFDAQQQQQQSQAQDGAGRGGEDAVPLLLDQDAGVALKFADVLEDM